MSHLIAARLLGPLELTVDGQQPPAELLWRKHLGLCLALWFAPGRRRSRDQLIGLLWAVKTDRAARHSLNEALRVVRRAVGDDAIVTGADGIRWVAHLDLDIERFAACESSDPFAAAALIGGTFCDGFAVTGAPEFEQWLADERTRWSRRLVATLARCATAAEDRGDADAAVALADRALAIDPYSELAAQAGIRACALRGDRAAALALGGSYRARLDRELSIPIDRVTAGLIERVASERGPRLPASPAPPPRRVPLIARGAELRALLDAWRASVATAQPALLTIGGGAGSGRSRLLDELVMRARLVGATAVTLRAIDADGSSDHSMLLGLAASGLQSAGGLAASPPTALAAFTALLPAWTERFPAVGREPAMPLRDAFVAVVRSVAEEHPVVLAIDDAERAHPDELAWLPAFIRALSGVPVTVALTVNDAGPISAADELLHRVGRDIGGASVKALPFQLADMELLADAMLESWPDEARSRLARRLMADSGGSPAIAVEVLDAVLNGLSLGSGAPWPAADRTLDATLPAPLPGSLVAAIRLAFRRLDADHQAMLTAAALLDEPFSADRLGRALGIGDPDLRDRRLDMLEWHRWVVADGRGYSFPARAKRRLIVDELMTPGQRRRLELQIAALN